MRYVVDEFGVTGEHRHIVNGHVPVRSIKGENPIKANGKLLVIDGGFSKAYHRRRELPVILGLSFTRISIGTA